MVKMSIIFLGVDLLLTSNGWIKLSDIVHLLLNHILNIFIKPAWSLSVEKFGALTAVFLSTSDHRFSNFAIHLSPSLHALDDSKFFFFGTVANSS